MCSSEKDEGFSNETKSLIMSLRITPIREMIRAIASDIERVKKWSAVSLLNPKSLTFMSIVNSSSLNLSIN